MNNEDKLAVLRLSVEGHNKYFVAWNRIENAGITIDIFDEALSYFEKIVEVAYGIKCVPAFFEWCDQINRGYDTIYDFHYALLDLSEHPERQKPIDNTFVDFEEFLA